MDHSTKHMSMVCSVWGQWLESQRCKEHAWFSILAQGEVGKSSEFGNDWVSLLGWLSLSCWGAKDLSTEQWGAMAGQRLSQDCGSQSVNVKAFQKVVGPLICWCSAAQHAQTSLVLHQPERLLSATPTGTVNSLHPEWFGCQCIYPASAIQWYDDIFCAFECLYCTLFTIVSLGLF